MGAAVGMLVESCGCPEQGRGVGLLASSIACCLLLRVYGSSNLPWDASRVERRLLKSLKKQEYCAKPLMLYAGSMWRRECVPIWY